MAPIGDGEKREEAKETHDLDYILRQGREREKKHAEKTAILKSQVRVQEVYVHIMEVK